MKRNDPSIDMSVSLSRNANDVNADARWACECVSASGLGVFFVALV